MLVKVCGRREGDRQSALPVTRMGIVDKPTPSASPGFSVSKDGRRFLWSQVDHQDADLMLVEHFR
jgi:hypothetical protein